MEAYLIAVNIIGSFLLCSWLAEEKGRGVITWGMLGLVFGVLALLALVGAPIRERK